MMRTAESRKNASPEGLGYSSDLTEDVVCMLDKTCAFDGYPKAIRVDQGSEFVPETLIWG